MDCEPADRPEENMVTYLDAALYKAAGEGKFEEFKNYKASGSELGSLLFSFRTPNQNTVLHVYLATLSYGWLGFLPEISKPTNFVRKVLNNCPLLLRQPNAKGQTPLHIAAMEGHYDVVKFLISRAVEEATGRVDHGGDIEKQQQQQRQGMEAVREMLREKDKESNTALHIAARYGNLEIVRALVEFEDHGFSYPANESQETPLYIAAACGRSHRLVAEMLDKCNNTTAHGGRGPHGRTVLHAVVMGGDKETAKISLKKNQKLTREIDEKGRTPLHYAAHLGHFSIVRKLLKCDKSAAYIADKDTGMTPLLMAARQGHEDIVREIVSSCPDCCEMVDKNSGWNLLHFVAIRQSPLELHLFLTGEIGNITKELYASIRFLRDEKDINGNTPLELYVAARYHFFLESSPGFLHNDTKEVALCMKNLSRNKKEQILETVKMVMSGEVAEVAVSSMVKLSDMLAVFDKARDAHLVVAALIATVTFAAGITLPGGFNGGDKGAELQGTAILIHNAAFKAFVITDALALVFSVAAIGLHFQMSLPRFKIQESFKKVQLAVRFTFYAVCAMMVAFSTATYAVLQPSSGLAIATCCIGLGFFFFVSMTSQIKILSRIRDGLLRMQMCMRRT